MGGEIMFGPGHFDGSMTVPDLKGYKVYFADECGDRIGDTPIASITVHDVTYSCCRNDMHLARFGAKIIPDGATKLVVTIDTTDGELPVGRSVRFNDLAYNASLVRTTSSALRVHASPRLLAVALAVTSAGLYLAAV